MKLKILSLGILLVAISCNHSKEIYYPLHRNTSEDYIAKSAEQNKKLREAEEQLIQEWISTQAIHTYQRTASGFWISYLEQHEQAKPKDLDVVQYQMQIEDFNGDVIYSFDEIGTKQIVLGKVYEIRGVDDALRMMSSGDESIVLLPSFLSYGLYGDENKIGANTPIKVQIKLLNIIHAKNS